MLSAWYFVIKNTSLNPSIARTVGRVVPVLYLHILGAETTFIEEQ